MTFDPEDAPPDCSQECGAEETASRVSFTEPQSQSSGGNGMMNGGAEPRGPHSDDMSGGAGVWVGGERFNRPLDGLR